MDELEETAPSPEERRKHDRSRLIVDVFYNGQDATGVASTQDISVGGLYMNTQAELPEGSALLLRIPLPSGNEVIVNGEVAFVNAGTGVGISFQGLTDEARALLETELGHG
ncbi:MAG TPA: PilZ domain-containing protein [Pyrinomonadaceae bacterium]|nr:PilZ domain-containing protein [Pyrinomonadaceae bacterium]